MNKSDLGLGCWQFGPSFGFWDGQDHLNSLRVLHKTLRDNIRHFDTATSYGNGGSEQLLGHQLKRFAKTIGRENLSIATKVMPKSPSLVRKDVHKSLSRFCTPYLDILYLHWPSSTIDLPPILEAMAELKSEGLVRSLGLSNFPLSLLPSFADYPTYKALYAILAEVSDKHQRPLAQIAIKWSMSQDFDVLLLGARNKSQLEENLAAISIELSEDEFAALDRAAFHLAATIPSGQDNLFGHRW